MRSGARDGRAYAKALSWGFALAGALVWTGAAAPAPPPPPEDLPAVSAYVELVPTSRGSRAPRAGRTESGTLPPEIEAKLAREGGNDAPLLKEVATSQAYGAPQSRRGIPDGAEATGDPALGAAVSVVTDGTDGRLLALGLVLIGVTAGAAAAAFFRRPRGLKSRR